MESTRQNIDLNGTSWDCCVIGNGVAALWVSHWLWSSKKSVLWISSEEPYSPERAALQHAWLWGLSNEHAELLASQLMGFDASSSSLPFEVIHFDAKSSKRFKQITEAKADWGAHEKEFFQGLIKSVAETPSRKDLWDWHSKLHAFYEIGTLPGSPQSGPTCIELFSEPRFVRVQGWPVIELKTTEGKVSGAVLAGVKAGEPMEISTTSFFLGDFDENLSTLIKNHEDAEVLAAALKGKAYRAGFGLHLWHNALEQAPTQVAAIPLVVSPEKDAGAHVVGRFVQKPGGLESVWVGFLTDEELEDNNEILKKIKQTKRAVERAIPGFAASIAREAVSFEPRMRATDLVKSRKLRALGAVLFSDHYGPDVAAETVKKIFSGRLDAEEDQAEQAVETTTKSAKGGKRSKRDREPEAAL